MVQLIMLLHMQYLALCKSMINNYFEQTNKCVGIMTIPVYLFIIWKKNLNVILLIVKFCERAHSWFMQLKMDHCVSSIYEYDKHSYIFAYLFSPINIQHCVSWFFDVEWNIYNNNIQFRFMLIKVFSLASMRCRKWIFHSFHTSVKGPSSCLKTPRKYKHKLNSICKRNLTGLGLCEYITGWFRVQLCLLFVNVEHWLWFTCFHVFLCFLSFVVRTSFLNFEQI